VYRWNSEQGEEHRASTPIWVDLKTFRPWFSTLINIKNESTRPDVPRSCELKRRGSCAMNIDGTTPRPP